MIIQNTSQSTRIFSSYETPHFRVISNPIYNRSYNYDDHCDGTWAGSRRCSLWRGSSGHVVPSLQEPDIHLHNQRSGGHGLARLCLAFLLWVSLVVRLFVGVFVLIIVSYLPMAWTLAGTFCIWRTNLNRQSVGWWIATTHMCTICKICLHFCISRRPWAHETLNAVMHQLGFTELSTYTTRSP